jgi:hypothetical protein
MRSNALAPSVSGELFAAVTVPCLRSKAGLSFAYASILRVRLDRRVLTDEVVFADRLVEAIGHEDLHHLVIELAFVPRLAGERVAAVRELVLSLAADVVFLRHLLGAVAHRKAGRELLDGGGHGCEVTRANPGECLHAFADASCLGRRHEGLGEALRHGDRDDACAVGAAGDSCIDRAGHNRLGDIHRRLVARRTGTGDAVGLDVFRHPGRQDDLAGDVRGFDRRHHLSVDDLLDFFRVEIDSLKHLGDHDLGEAESADLTIC